MVRYHVGGDCCGVGGASEKDEWMEERSVCGDPCRAPPVRPTACRFLKAQYTLNK